MRKYLEFFSPCACQRARDLNFLHTIFQFALVAHLKLLDFPEKDYFQKLNMIPEIRCLTSALQLSFPYIIHCIFSGIFLNVIFYPVPH